MVLFGAGPIKAFQFIQDIQKKYFIKLVPQFCAKHVIEIFKEIRRPNLQR